MGISVGVFQRHKNIILAIIVFGVAMSVFGGSSYASAATKTWTGGGADHNWSTANNWTPSGAPVNGDDLVFDVTASNTPTADMSGLQVASMAFTNATSTAENFTLRVSSPFTLGGTINTGTKGDLLTLSLDAAAVTLGSDVSVQGSGFFNFDSWGTSDPANAIDLDGHALTFEVTNATSSVRVPITGSGTINANTVGIINALNLEGASTYSGTTNIKGNVATKGATPFGTSAVSIATTGSVNFSNTADTTLNNAITMAGSDTINGLSFSGIPSTIKYTVPHVTLNGNVRFNNSVSAVDLTGITANGHCATYFGGPGGAGADITEGSAHGFTGGPAGCIFRSDDGASAGSKKTPKTPDTGFGIITDNPWVAVVAAAIAAGAIIFIARRYRANQ